MSVFWFGCFWWFFCDYFKCTTSGNGYNDLIQELTTPTPLFQDLMAKIQKNLLFVILCSISIIAFLWLMLIWRKKNHEGVSDVQCQKNLVRCIGTRNILAKQSEFLVYSLNRQFWHGIYKRFLLELYLISSNHSFYPPETWTYRTCYIIPLTVTCLIITLPQAILLSFEKKRTKCWVKLFFLAISSSSTLPQLRTDDKFVCINKKNLKG